MSSIFPIDENDINCPNLPCVCSKDCPKIELKAGTRKYLENIFNNPLFEQEFNNSANDLIPKIKDEWFNIFKYLITTCCCNFEKITGEIDYVRKIQRTRLHSRTNFKLH